ncbi:MAG: hypothetical protein PHH67_07255 [Methanosarcina sp.]|nr:hypothetical protein [Methanosarcina sp.]
MIKNANLLRKGLTANLLRKGLIENPLQRRDQPAQRLWSMERIGKE